MNYKEIWRDHHKSMLSDPLKVMTELGGYYECPKDEQGNRLGPLVGYTGKYDDTHHYVGDVYINAAVAEEYPYLLDIWAEQLQSQLAAAGVSQKVFCGTPYGGLAFAQALALRNNSRYIYMEKKVTKLATETAREESCLIFNRHQVGPGDQVILVEDVVNNFSTTDQMIAEVARGGGQVVAIACILNRSTDHSTHYPTAGLSLPIISLVRKAINEYRQDDPFVVDDVTRGSVVWKPKDKDARARLKAAMQQIPA